MNAKISPLFWNRYVDGTFTMFHNKDSAAVMTILNLPLNLNRTMQFRFWTFCFGHSDCSKTKSRDRLSTNHIVGFVPGDIQDGGQTAAFRFDPYQPFVLIDRFPSNGRIRKGTRQKSSGLRRVC